MRASGNLSSIGRVLKEFKKYDTSAQTQPPITKLTPCSYGVIEIDESMIQRLSTQKNILKSTFQKSESTKLFTYIDYIVNEGFKEKEGNISYDEILSQFNKFYKNMGFYFADPSKGVLHRNYHVLEYHLFHYGYDVRVDPQNESNQNTIKHLVLFSLVDEKETLESQLNRSPTAMIHPGQVLTMIKQMAKSLKYIFLESDLYVGSSEKKPLIPWSVEVKLTDIYVFKKLDYKLNLLQDTTFDREKTCILNNKIIDEIERIKNSITYLEKEKNEEDLKLLYSFALNSLAIAAIRFTINEALQLGKVPDLKETMESKALDDVDLRDLESRLKNVFVNEFKEEADLLRHVISQMLTAFNRIDEEPFDYDECVKGYLPYVQRDPKEKLLLSSFTKIGWNKNARMESIREKVLSNEDLPRDLELQLLCTKAKELNKFGAKINEDQKEAQKPVSVKPVVLPYLEVEYPLENADVSNISQNASQTNEGEKLLCQIYPIYEKDFFVYRALTSQLMLSIEFNDDLTVLLSALSQNFGYINAEIDNERRIVFRSALTLQAFENEIESHINSMDHLVIVAVLIIRKLNYCIEYEEFGRIAKNTKLIIDEISYHLQNYREQLARKDV